MFCAGSSLRSPRLSETRSLPGTTVPNSPANSIGPYMMEPKWGSSFAYLTDSFRGKTIFIVSPDFIESGRRIYSFLPYSSFTGLPFNIISGFPSTHSGYLNMTEPENRPLSTTHTEIVSDSGKSVSNLNRNPCSFQFNSEGIYRFINRELPFLKYMDSAYLA